jgi:hypothetical protein
MARSSLSGQAFTLLSDLVPEGAGAVSARGRPGCCMTPAGTRAWSSYAPKLKGAMINERYFIARSPFVRFWQFNSSPAWMHR